MLWPGRARHAPGRRRLRWLSWMMTADARPQRGVADATSMRSDLIPALLLLASSSAFGPGLPRDDHQIPLVVQSGHDDIPQSEVPGCLSAIEFHSMGLSCIPLGKVIPRSYALPSSSHEQFR
nr:hypothetical protein CFP56_13261 [Quercus suber]